MRAQVVCPAACFFMHVTGTANLFDRFSWSRTIFELDVLETTNGSNARSGGTLYCTSWSHSLPREGMK